MKIICAVLTALCLLPAAVPAQEKTVEELEKQLRATQDYMFTEFGRLSKPKETGKQKGALVSAASSEKLDLSGYIQVRYLWTEGGTSARNKAVPVKKAFDDNSARLKLQGKLDAPTKYRFQMEFTQTKQFALLDGWVSRALYGEQVELLAGQFQPKTQGNGTLEYRQFMDVSNSSGTNAAERRDRGLSLRGVLLDKTLTYELHMVNGNGISATVHDDTDFRYGLLLKYEPWGRLGLFQNDIEKSSLRFAFGSAYSRERRISTVVGHQRMDWLVSSIQCKWNGLYGKLLGARQEADDTAGSAKDQVYGALQAGYAVPVKWGHMLEPVFRYEYIDKNTSSEDQVERWTTLGFNYYLKGNTSRLQFNYISKKEQDVNKTPNNSLKGGVAIMF